MSKPIWLKLATKKVDVQLHKKQKQELLGLFQWVAWSDGKFQPVKQVEIRHSTPKIACYTALSI